MSHDAPSQYPYNYPIKGCFIVENIITNSNKTIRIFDYPILVGGTRDILRIPGISEADIRASLLKGEIRNKLLAKEIRIICSDIDLLQFNPDQKKFLMQGGVTYGTEVNSANISYLWREEISLIGLRDGVNRMFFTPDKFLNGFVSSGDQFHINVKHNGKDLYEGIDYTISESSGPGTGYDTINMISITPNTHSLLFANYTINNNL